MRQSWTGVGTALVTPFTRDGRVDEAAVRRLARRQIDEGVHFVVPCGTTGESPTLTHEEHLRVVELVLARELEDLGVQGILSVTPYYNKPTQEGLVRHYERIASSTALPIVLYNVPGRTGCNIEPRTVARLAAIPTVVGVKEASGNMTQMCEVLRLVPGDFIVLSGDDALTLPLMAVGGRGIISVASNVVPGPMVAMVEAAERGDFEAARAEHKRLMRLMLVNFVESNPIPVKSAMAMLGLLEENYRLPMVPPGESSRGKIQEALAELGLTVAR